MKITNLREINKGLMISSFDVTIEEWGVTFKRCTLFRTDEKQWVSFPSSKFTDSMGQVKYAPYVFMEKEKKAKFDMKVIDMIKTNQFEKAKEQPKANSQTSFIDEECPF